MTLTTNSVTQRFFANGVTLRFDLAFTFFDAEEVEVVERTTASGQESVRELNIHYTVVGGAGGTGALIATIAPPVGVEWHARRRTRRLQLADYQENDAFSAEGHERALDRLQAQVQEIDADHERTLRLSVLADPIAPLPPLQDGGFLRAGTDPDRLEWAHLANVGPLVVTPYIQTLLDDTTAIAARATLGLGSGIGTVTSIDLGPVAGGAAGLSFQGGPVTGSGTLRGSLAIQTLPVDAIPNAAADYVATYSTAHAAHRRVRIDQLPVPPVPDGGITTPKLASQAVTAAKMAAGAAVQGASNVGTAAGQVFLDRQADTLRFRRIQVQKTTSGSGNAVSDANISITTGADTVTITLTVSKVTITDGGSGGE